MVLGTSPRTLHPPVDNLDGRFPERNVASVGLAGKVDVLEDAGAS